MQQQQHMAGGMGSGRPPPPEYKAAAQAQMMHASIGMSQQARFANAGSMRRVTQQPMPPSGKFGENISFRFIPAARAYRFFVLSINVRVQIFYDNDNHDFNN